MPKEYINYPDPEDIKDLQTWLGMPADKVDGKVGSVTRNFWKEDLEDPNPFDRETNNYRAVSPPPMVGLHWDGKNGTIQISLDVDWDVLQEMVKARQDNPNANFADDNSFLLNRVTFYTGALDREDLQRLLRVTRRARNAVFGADE